MASNVKRMYNLIMGDWEKKSVEDRDASDVFVSNKVVVVDYSLFVEMAWTLLCCLLVAVLLILF
jgi:hypothetical protein